MSWTGHYLTSLALGEGFDHAPPFILSFQLYSYLRHENWQSDSCFYSAFYKKKSLLDFDNFIVSYAFSCSAFFENRVLPTVNKRLYTYATVKFGVSFDIVEKLKVSTFQRYKQFLRATLS